MPHHIDKSNFSADFQIIARLRLPDKRITGSVVVHTLMLLRNILKCVVVGGDGVAFVAVAAAAAAKVCAEVRGSLTGRHYYLHVTGVSKVRLISKIIW